MLYDYLTCSCGYNFMDALLDCRDDDGANGSLFGPDYLEPEALAAG